MTASDLPDEDHTLTVTYPDVAPPVPPEPHVPTQIAHPWRATARTVAAWVAAVVLFLVVAIPIVIEVAGPYLPDWFAAALAGTLTILTVLVTLATRLMQLPQMQPFLDLLRLGPRPHVPEDAPLTSDSSTSEPTRGPPSSPSP